MENGGTRSQMHLCWQEATVGLPAFSVAMKSGPQHQKQQLSWRPREAQQLHWGSRLEEFHVVLWDEASLSIQSPLQPARLLRWMNIIEDGARCEGELRVVLSLAGVQSLCLPEWCAVCGKAGLFNTVFNPRKPQRVHVSSLLSLQAT